MTKADLVDQVAETVQLPKSKIDTVLTQCLQSIMAALQAGETVALRGFRKTAFFTGGEDGGEIIQVSP